MAFKRKHTEETKRKIGEASRKHWQNPEYRRRTCRAISRAAMGKKFSKKHKDNLSRALKGKHNSPETEFKKGGHPGKEFQKGHPKPKNAYRFPKGHTLGKGISPSNKGKPRLDIRGKKHPNWKGGVSRLRDRVYSSYKYKQWRGAVFKRDGYVCQECGAKSGGGRSVYLEAHHKKQQWRIFKENNIKTIEDVLGCDELWDVNNGQTLCRKCHQLTKKGRKFV